MREHTARARIFNGVGPLGERERRAEFRWHRSRLTMDLADVMLHLFGLARGWSARARGFAFLLALPALVVTFADWRIRRRS